MPIYEYRCLECGEVFSLLSRQAIPPSSVGADLSPPTADLSASLISGEGEESSRRGPIYCAHCGSGQTQRLISSFAIGGRADPGPGRAAWPTSWNDTNGADPETLRYWRRRIEREARLEEKYPELRDPSPSRTAMSAGEGSSSLNKRSPPPSDGQRQPPARNAPHEGGTEHSHDEHQHHHQHNHVELGGTSSTEHS